MGQKGFGIERRDITYHTTKVVVMNLLYGKLIQGLKSLSTLTTPRRKNHELLIYRLDISIIERNSFSYAFCNLLKFPTWVVLSYEFLRMAVFGVK